MTAEHCRPHEFTMLGHATKACTVYALDIGRLLLSAEVLFNDYLRKCVFVCVCVSFVVGLLDNCESLQASESLEACYTGKTYAFGTHVVGAGAFELFSTIPPGNVDPLMGLGFILRRLFSAHKNVCGPVFSFLRECLGRFQGYFLKHLVAIS